MTVAPARLASCAAVNPPPPDAPDTTTTSPACGCTAFTPARPAIGVTYKEPATSQDNAAGLRTSCVAGTATSWACAAQSCDHPRTPPPPATSFAPSPTATTSPARSRIGTYAAPPRADRDPGLRDVARTRTTASPGPGLGSGTSAM